MGLSKSPNPCSQTPTFLEGPSLSLLAIHADTGVAPPILAPAGLSLIEALACAVSACKAQIFSETGSRIHLQLVKIHTMQKKPQTLDQGQAPRWPWH